MLEMENSVKLGVKRCRRANYSGGGNYSGGVNYSGGGNYSGGEKQQQNSVFSAPQILSGHSFLLVNTYRPTNNFYSVSIYNNNNNNAYI